MRAKGGFPRGSLMTSKNAKGFIITSNGDCGYQEASTSRYEGLSLAERSSQASSKDVLVNQETYVSEPEESYQGKLS